MAALTLAACGAPGAADLPASPGPSPEVSITVVTDPATIGAYTPPAATARVGDTVRWTFTDENPHTATADDGSFDSTTLSSGRTYSHTFEAPGTFAYHCEIHPSMHGTVVVS
jgi:plastocyanin